MNDDNRYKAARKRARQIAGFYRSLAIYAVGVVFFFLVDVLSGPDDWWFFWPVLGWGIWILWRGVMVFGYDRIFGADWEERKAAELLGEKSKRTASPEYFENDAAE